VLEGFPKLISLGGPAYHGKRWEQLNQEPINLE
jgi:hypothetical protein